MYSTVVSINGLKVQTVVDGRMHMLLIAIGRAQRQSKLKFPSSHGSGAYILPTRRSTTRSAEIPIPR